MKHISFNLRGKLYIVLAVIVSLFITNVDVYAETFDITHKGSISMKLRSIDSDSPVSGAEFYIYKAAECTLRDGVLYHYWSSDFEGAGLDILTVNKKETALAAATYATTESLPHITATTDNYGKFVKSDLEVGLYLVMQKNVVTGFTKTSPFFVTVGRIDGEKVYYDVDASPKVQVKGKPSGTGGNGPKPTPVITPKVTPGVTPKVTPTPAVTGPTLAQTGQSRWQIPLLSCVGLGFILTGLMIRTGKDEE